MKIKRTLVVFAITLILVLVTACGTDNAELNSENGVKGDWEISSEKVEHTQYEYELIYKILDEDTYNYIYFTPEKTPSVQYYTGNYYMRFNVGDLTIKTSSSEIYIASNDMLIITTEFSLRKIN